MRRRDILRLLATAAAGSSVKQLLPERLLAAGGASGVPGRWAPAVAVRAQESSPVEPLLPLFPLRLVLFPNTSLALHIFEERYKEMIRDCLQNQWEFGIALAQAIAFEKVGCTASIVAVTRRYADGRMDIVVRGQRRFEVSLLNREKSYLRGAATFFDDDPNTDAPEALREKAARLYSRLIELLASDDPAEKSPAHTANEEQLSFRIMSELPADLSAKQRLLESRSEQDRLDHVIRHLQQLVEYLEQLPENRPPGNTA